MVEISKKYLVDRPSYEEKGKILLAISVYFAALRLDKWGTTTDPLLLASKKNEDLVKSYLCVIKRG